MKKKFLGLLGISCFIFLSACASVPSTISGVVQDQNGPVAGATVRVQTTELFSITDQNGEFTISELQSDDPVRLTAWAPGYFIVASEGRVSPGETEVLLTLISHSAADHPDYQWVSAFSEAGDEGNCQNCHASPDGSEVGLPVR